MLFQKKGMQKGIEGLFQNPTAEYRGAPFWAWNCKMTKEKIDETISELQEMGMGGGHIHCRTGMDNPYLGPEFLGLVKYANEEFRKRNMLTWLYDEDRWPSGSGGGFVTKEDKYRIRFLVFSPHKLTEGFQLEVQKTNSSGQAIRSENRTFLGSYAVKLENGYLADYKFSRTEEAETPGYDNWYAYLEISGDNPWFNNQAYLNTLDQKAVERFIEVTHEAYKRTLSAEFGNSIPAIFTDEPQFSSKTKLGRADEKREITIPYTDDLEESFYSAYGHSLLEALPELFWELADNRFSVVRYQYHDHICERFASAYADTIGAWCQANNLLLTGHMMEEPTLESQTTALGEAMRSYRSFTLPGIDMLCDRRELSTAKQAQSAAHQYGRDGVISELYGVTDWDFDFRGHKLQGDWQAALGVVVRVPHLTWTSMAGEAKRDYPAAIGYQSPWYQEYRYVEDYFARLNTILTRGTTKVRIGVVHPIESYWLYWGCEEQTGGIRKEMDQNFASLLQWLLYGLLDFDFIAESLFPQLTPLELITDNRLPVGAMDYDVVVVPNCITLRKSTYERLRKFQQAGGRIVFAGNTPVLLDAVPSKEVEDFVRTCIHTVFTENALLDVLEEYRIVDVRDSKGMRIENVIYQLREDGKRQWLFLAHVHKMKNSDLPLCQKTRITVQGKWSVTGYNPLTGNTDKIASVCEKGTTVLERELYDHDSVLLCLEPLGKEMAKPIEAAEIRKENDFFMDTATPQSSVPVTLSEPNVCVLDIAEWQFDEEPWQAEDELLRIDNKCRRKAGYPLRMEALAQPWLEQRELKPEHTLKLRYQIETEQAVKGSKLAGENLQKFTVMVNGEPVTGSPDGWYVDREIETIALPDLKEGKNQLDITIPIHKKQNVENFYLLGDFGVRVAGSRSKLTAPVRELAFGDITGQGLPFYGGNVHYLLELEIESETAEYKIAVPQFRNPVIKVLADGKQKGYIAFSPYEQNLGILGRGRHQVELIAYGNRRNTFGTLHNCNSTETWIGPNAWRTRGNEFAYEYQIRPTGILKAPLY